MAYPGELGIGSERLRGHRYGDVNINDGAKAHLGDSYHVRTDDPLHHLPFAKDAPFNAYSKQHEHDCHPGTRVDLLHEIYKWADRQDERRIFWLSGLAGTGKSTVARTVARSYYDKQRLAASFFFSRGGGDAGHATRFVTSIAVQLAHSIPALRQHICDAITERSDIINLSLRDQWQQLVCRPLSKLGTPQLCVVVIDALDECDNDDNIRIILRLLVEARSLTTQLRVLLTTRPEVPIRYQFKQMAEGEHKAFVLHDISQVIVDHDIGLFLQESLQRIAKERNLRAGWPGVEIVTRLVESAGGRFIWAETACRFIREGKGRAPRRLKAILCRDTSTSIASEKHLNELYTAVLQNSIQNFTGEEKEEQSSAVRDVLGSIVALFSPLSTQSLDQLLSVPDGVRPILEDLHAILDIPNDLNLPLRLHHPSLRDFLFNKERCSDENFWVDEKSAHETLALRCLELMSASGGLRQDICSLSEPGVLIGEIEESTIMASLSPELQYACCYWVKHLEGSGRNIKDGDTTHRFLEKHFLHWLEVMSLIRETGLCVRLVVRMQSLAALSPSAVASFLHDAYRFVLRFVPIIEEAPLQLYSSALVFSPEASLIRRIFVQQVLQVVEMVFGGDVKWSACRNTLEGHSNWVNAVVFSPDGKLIASTSYDTTVRLWETATGQCYSVLQGHSAMVKTVVFSPNGLLVASGSYDETVRLWDTSTGYCCRVLDGHLDQVTTSVFPPYEELEQVTAVVFSPDGELVASISTGGTARLWETSTGCCHRVLRNPNGWRSAAVFSPNGEVVALVSRRGTVQLWETATGYCRKKLDYHAKLALALVFSPDGQLITLAFDDGAVWLWDTATDDCRRLSKGHSRTFETAAFSPDGQTVAFSGNTWTQLCKTTDQGYTMSMNHPNCVFVMAFSPDSQLVASVSNDYKLQLWNAAGRNCRALEGHSDEVVAVAFSPDGKLVASASRDCTLRIWETEGHCGVSKSNSGAVYEVNFSTGGKLIASVYRDNTLRLWNTTGTGDIVIRKHHKEFIPEVAFSLDAKLIASTCFVEKIWIWDTTTGECRWVSDELSDGLSDEWSKTLTRNIEFLPDGRTLRINKAEITLPLHLRAAPTIPPTSEPVFQIPTSYKRLQKWVSYRNRRFLWLPPEYRTEIVAVYGDMVCLGCRTGRVVLLRFSQT